MKMMIRIILHLVEKAVTTIVKSTHYLEFVNFLCFLVNIQITFIYLPVEPKNK